VGGCLCKEERPKVEVGKMVVGLTFVPSILVFLLSVLEEFPAWGQEGVYSRG
jgi:hypothetical protein